MFGIQSLQFDAHFFLFASETTDKYHNISTYEHTQTQLEPLEAHLQNFFQIVLNLIQFLFK